MKLVLVGVAALATAFLLGVGLGWLSWLVMVIGLFILIIGLAVGVVVGGMLVATGTLRARWAPRVIAVAAVVTAWAAVQVVEDRHFFQGHVDAEVMRRWKLSEELRAAYREPDDPALAALVREPAEAGVRAQVATATGGDDLAHRWWYRAQSGVRLAGPWVGSRGLPVGAVGVVVWSILENALTVALALTVVRRVRRRLTP